jgi:ketosteroid isomerase-like protein
MAHSGEELLRKGYDAFGRGDMETLRKEVFAPDIRWHFPGRSQIAGDFSSADEVFAFFGKLADLSAGTFHVDLHDVIANDDHVVVLATALAERGGKRLEDKYAQTLHVRNGRISECWVHLSDLYAWDDVFA